MKTVAIVLCMIPFLFIIVMAADPDDRAQIGADGYPGCSFSRSRTVNFFPDSQLMTVSRILAGCRSPSPALPYTAMFLTTVWPNTVPEATILNKAPIAFSADPRPESKEFLTGLIPLNAGYTGLFLR